MGPTDVQATNCRRGGGLSRVWRELSNDGKVYLPWHCQWHFGLREAKEEYNSAITVLFLGGTIERFAAVTSSQ